MLLACTRKIGPHEEIGRADYPGHDWVEKTGIPILDSIGTTEMLHLFISNRQDDSRPAMTMVQVSALVEDRALVEVEATAVV